MTNTDSVTYSWIKVTRPSSDFTFKGHSVSGFTVSTFNEGEVVLTVGTVNPSSLINFVIQASAGDSAASSSDWGVQVSDDGGVSSYQCSGSLGTQITAGASEITISDIVVSDISDTQAKISWSTDVSATTVVDYGTTDEYGSTGTGDAGTSHSVTISGLTANTTYHYNIKSSDAESGDNTFTTARQGTTTTVTVTGATTTRTVTPTPTPKDTSPPRVSVTTDFSKPFTAAPAMKGTATDPSGVASLEYSLDNGKSWLPVETITAPGKSSTTFELSPESLLDANYVLKIRAADLKGNTGETPIATLIIDRLPPRIGSVIATLGPQILSPQADGSYIVPAGLDVKFTVSAVGGPTSIDLGNTSLKKNSDNGLWSGVLRFDNPGTYTVRAYAVDGAGNSGERDVATVTAVSGGQVSSGGVPVRAGRVTVYYLDSVMKQFVLWDGESYGQTNPQPLQQDGGYTAYLPAGTYYIDVAAPGYKSLVTSIFTLPAAAPITTDFTLDRARALQIGPWLIPLPDFRLTTATVTPNVSAAPLVASPLAGREFPYFRLLDGAKPITSFDIRGKPTIITFINTWMPDTTTQMAILSDVADKKDINILVIVPQETVSSVSIFKERGGYTMPVIADPDGDLVEPLHLHSLPTHITVDRKGVITGMKTGVYNNNELFDMMIQ